MAGDMLDLTSKEIEIKLLALLISAPERMDTLDLESDDFYYRTNRKLYETIKGMHEGDHPISYQTLLDTIQRQKYLDDIGGAAGLSMYIEQPLGRYSAADYTRILRDYRRRRDLMLVAGKIATSAGDLKRDFTEDIGTYIDQLVGTALTREGASVMGASYQQLADMIAYKLANPGQVWGIPTGFKDLDHVTGGLQPGELVMVSGEPGVGKSMWVMQAGLQMALLKYPGAIYSMEMSTKQVMTRYLSSITKVPTRSIKTGVLSDDDVADIEKAGDIIRGLPVYITDAPTWTLAAMRADLSRLKAQYDIQWFIVDYLMLMSSPGDNEIERTAELSRGLKQICKALQISGVAIHSMNKSGLDTGVVPTQAMLRGSAQVPYDADLILFLTKYIKMGNDAEVLPQFTDNVRTLFIGKGRELANPRSYMYFTKAASYPKFTDFVAEEVH